MCYYIYIRSLYLSAAGGDAYGYQDPVSGEFYGKEFVKNTDLSAFFSRKRRLSDCKIKEMSF